MMYLTSGTGMNTCRILFLVLLFFSVSGFGQNDSLSFVTPGVILTYRVSYGPFRIGTVKYEMLGMEKYQGRTVIRSRMFLDSNPAFIFIRLHSTFESLTDSSGFSLWMHAVEEIEGKQVISTYQYDPQRSFLFMEEHFQTKKGRGRNDSLQLMEPYFDGLSLAYLTRRDIRKKYQQRFPTIADFKIRESTIHFEGVQDTVYLKALDLTMDAYRISGKVDLGARAMAGLSGKFRGWFSVDSSVTPLKAEMGIFIGRVVLQLEGINRPNWPD